MDAAFATPLKFTQNWVGMWNSKRVMKMKLKVDELLREYAGTIIEHVV